jgi:metal-responsive CopG/Arc/MetJ family transcriptional regulator
MNSVPIGISLDRDLLETIDRARGDIPRSRFIARLVEKSLKELEHK